LHARFPFFFLFFYPNALYLLKQNTKPIRMAEEKVILLIEDNPSDVDLMKRAFDKKKILNKIVVAEDGEIALTYLFSVVSDTKPNSPRLPSVILLDLNLPKKDGREVLKEIKTDENLKRIPVVILTVSKAEEDIIKKTGADGGFVGDIGKHFFHGINPSTYIFIIKKQYKTRIGVRSPSFQL